MTMRTPTVGSSVPGTVTTRWEPIHPGAIEICNDLDDDCNGQVDELDSDSDAIPDCIDNCPQLGIAQQSDGDDDGEGDACDLDDGTIYVYWSNGGTLEWGPEVGSQTWNTYSGDFTLLVADGRVHAACGGKSAC